MSDNRCVCCGEQIPEGTIVCKSCFDKAVNKRSTEFAKAIDEFEEREHTRDTIDFIVWDLVIPVLIGAFILYMIFGWR